jgi:hypothetical protein
MHLGLNRWAFCTPFQFMGALLPYHTSSTPTLTFLMSSGSIKGALTYLFGSTAKEPYHTEPVQRQTLHSYSLLHPFPKVPGRKASFQVPQFGPLWKQMPVSRAFSIFPPGSQVGPLWKQMSVSRAFCICPPGSPARDLSLQVPFTEPPCREMPHLQSPFQPAVKVSGRQAPLHVAQLSLPAERCPTQSIFATQLSVF